MSRSKKTILIILGVIIAFVVVIIALISPITKYLVEKYDEKFTGRNIESDWVYVNPFTGYIHFNNLRIMESVNSKSFNYPDSIFFSAKGLSADFAMLKLMTKTVEISEITLNQPKGVVLQDKIAFNFDDLIKKFTPKDTASAPSKIHFIILRIKIKNGEFHYSEKNIPVKYFIKNVNLESPGKRYDSDTIAVQMSFIPGIGTGTIKGNITINFESLDYHFAVKIQKLDLNIIEQYLRDMMNYGSFSANLDADVKAKGNFSEAENLTATGVITVNDFHFGKNPENDFASFKKLVLAMVEISPKKHGYIFDSVSLSQPFLLYERYDDLDNIQKMFGKDGANIAAAASEHAKFNLVVEIARYVKVLAKNFFHSNYNIRRLSIYNGRLKFSDYAVSEKFSVELDPFYFTADSIDKSRDRVYATLKSGIKPYGNATVTLSINPKDSMDFDIRYDLGKIPATLFNPYIVTYTSFPLDRGTIEIKGNWRVRDGIINSDNHLLVIDPRRTDRIKNGDKKWLPLPFIMALVRERGNVIDYEIPITGKLNDPKFHLRDVLADVFENIFVKPATTSYRLKVKNLETKIEKSLTLTWHTRQNFLLRNQDKFVGKMVVFLKENPNATLAIYPMIFQDKEREHILLFEARKRYYISLQTGKPMIFSESDSMKVDKMSAKDSLFVRFLNRTIDDSLLFTIQEKCSSYVGSEIIDDRLKQLSNQRKNAFLIPFKEESVDKQVKFMAGENQIPYNGFSFYRIKYTGEFPESTLKAYRKMNELNDEVPRKKYSKARKTNKN